jgi:hypothetical protein
VAFYFAIIGRLDAWFWVPFSLLTLEIFIIVINWWKCPISKIAEKYAPARKANFDIYLPEWLAKYNIRIFAVLIPLEVLIVLTKRLA